jgi:uncharacterized protein YqeY
MLIEKINEDWKQALRNRDTIKKETLSLLRSAIKNLEIEKKGELDDTAIVNIINKEISKRNDAAVAFRKGGREESAVKEEAEAVVLKTYLPEQLSKDEIEKILEQVIIETDAIGIKDMGIVMKAMTVATKGAADNRTVSILVREKLS